MTVSQFFSPKTAVVVRGFGGGLLCFVVFFLPPPPRSPSRQRRSDIKRPQIGPKRSIAKK